VTNLLTRLDLLECLNSEHKDHVSMIGALKFMLERHISNLDNWAINLKGLIIFHRALQNIKVNRKVVKDLKSKEHLLHPY
jgi:predicted glycosyltransferase